MVRGGKKHTKSKMRGGDDGTGQGSQQMQSKPLPEEIGRAL